MCKTCLNKAGKEHVNQGVHKQCTKCKAPKGQCFKGKVARPEGVSPTVSKKRKDANYEKLYKEQLLLSQQHAKEKKSMAISIKNLEAKLGSAGDTAPVAKAGDPDDMAVDENTAASLRAAIATAAQELKELEACTEFQRSLIPEFGAKLETAKQKLESAKADKRAANPLKQQLDSAEAHQAKATAKLQAAKAKLAEKDKELSDLQQAIKEAHATVDEATAVLSKADAEVASLAAQFAAERTANPEAAALGPAPAGFVTVAFAEAKWEEREKEFNNIVATLHALVAGKQEEPLAASSAAPSEASDVQKISSLDGIECEDEGWKTVSVGARKAVASQHSAAIAAKVARYTSKVSKRSCPFYKTK